MEEAFSCTNPICIAQEFCECPAPALSCTNPRCIAQEFCDCGESALSCTNPRCIAQEFCDCENSSQQPEEYYDQQPEEYYDPFGLGGLIEPYRPCNECIENGNGMMCYKCRMIYNHNEPQCNRGMNCIKPNCKREHVPVVCYYGINCTRKDCGNIHRKQMSDDCKLFGLGMKWYERGDLDAKGHITACLKCRFESNCLNDDEAVLTAFYRSVIMNQFKKHTDTYVIETINSYGNVIMMYKELTLYLHRGNILRCEDIKIAPTNISQLELVESYQKLFVSTKTDRALTFVDYYTLGDFVLKSGKTIETLVNEFLKINPMNVKSLPAESFLFDFMNLKFMNYLYDTYNTYKENAKVKESHFAFKNAKSPLDLLMNYAHKSGNRKLLEELEDISGLKGSLIMPPKLSSILKKTSEEFIPATSAPESKSVYTTNAIDAIKTFCSTTDVRSKCGNDLRTMLNCYYIMEAYDMSFYDLVRIYGMEPGELVADLFYKKYGKPLTIQLASLIRAILSAREFGNINPETLQPNTFDNFPNIGDKTAALVANEMAGEEQLPFDKTIERIIDWIFNGIALYNEVQVECHEELHDSVYHE